MVLRLYKSILVPVDGSEYSSKAAKHAVELASSFKSKVIALHVIDVRVKRVYEGSEKALAQLRKFGEAYLQDVANMANRAKVPVETVLREGLPPEAIVKEAEDRGVDVIIMGTRGLSGAKRVVLGSTAEQVVEWATCPVLVVK